MNRSTNHQTNGSAPSASSGRHRRYAVLGVTAGLLGGGAIGLLSSTPSISSAAGSTSAIAAAVTEPTDDTATSTAVDTPTEFPDPSVRLRESLQTLVDDGTITSEQADAVAAHLGSLRGDMAGGMGRHGGAGRADGRARAGALAELLGIDATAVHTALQAGSTIAELAEANGVDVQTVIDGLVAAANVRIDEAVAAGRLTDTEAVTKRAELVTRITESVNTVPGGHHGGPHLG